MVLPATRRALLDKAPRVIAMLGGFFAQRLGLFFARYERLIALGLTGMAKALEEQRRQPDHTALDFEERLGLMIDRETIDREKKQLASRLRFAGLR
jgi:hypothetical protein